MLVFMHWRKQNKEQAYNNTHGSTMILQHEEIWNVNFRYVHYGQYMEIIFIYIDMILTLLLYVGKVRGTMTSCAKKSGWIEKTYVTKQYIKSVLPLCRAIWSWTVNLGIPNRLLQELIQAFSLPSLQLVFVNTFLLIH